MIKQIRNAFGYSWQGLKAAYHHQWALRAELLICCFAIPLALLIGSTMTQRALLISSIILVVLVELINSAIETIVDRISKDHHELSGRAKDIGSAAVLIAGVNAVVVWGLVTISYFTH